MSFRVEYRDNPVLQALTAYVAGLDQSGVRNQERADKLNLVNREETSKQAAAVSEQVGHVLNAGLQQAYHKANIQTEAGIKEKHDTATYNRQIDKELLDNYGMTMADVDQMAQHSGISRYDALKALQESKQNQQTTMLVQRAREVEAERSKAAVAEQQQKLDLAQMYKDYDFVLMPQDQARQQAILGDIQHIRTSPEYSDDERTHMLTDQYEKLRSIQRVPVPKGEGQPNAEKIVEQRTFEDKSGRLWAISAKGEPRLQAKGTMTPEARAKLWQSTDMTLPLVERKQQFHELLQMIDPSPNGAAAAGETNQPSSPPLSADGLPVGTSDKDIARLTESRRVWNYYSQPGAPGDNWQGAGTLGRAKQDAEVQTAVDDARKAMTYLLSKYPSVKDIPPASADDRIFQLAMPIIRGAAKRDAAKQQKGSPSKQAVGAGKDEPF